jgi:hypothetical protein
MSASRIHASPVTNLPDVMRQLVDAREATLQMLAADGDRETLELDAAARDLQSTFRLLLNYTRETDMRRSLLLDEEGSATVRATGLGTRCFKTRFLTAEWEYSRGCAIPDDLHVPDSCVMVMPCSFTVVAKPRRRVPAPPDWSSAPPPVTIGTGDPVMVVKNAIAHQERLGVPHATAVDRVARAAPGQFGAAQRVLAEQAHQPYRKIVPRF